MAKSRKGPIVVAVLLPLALFATTYAAFQAGVSRLGVLEGYLAAFVFYWAFWCLGVPLVLLGPSGVVGLFTRTPTLSTHHRRRRTPLTKTLAVFGMVWAPAIFAFVTIFPKTISRDARTLAFSLALSLVNGIAEEVLWRGLFLRLLPAKSPLSWVFTTVAYGAWHLAPCAIFPDAGPGGNVGLVLAASGIGALWGIAAHLNGTILASSLAHVALNLAGGGPVAVLPPILSNRA
eukprot:jgi/Botrbrau1/15004/Bobra.0018s0103.1